MLRDALDRGEIGRGGDVLLGFDELPPDEIIANLLKKNEEQRYFGARELMRRFPDMKEPIIDGLLRREEVMNLVAAPKTGKSWLVMQLAFSLAAGCEWQGRGCAKSRVLLIDNELHKETLGCRLAKVARAMGISPDDEILDNLTVFPQRGGKKDLRELKEKMTEFKEREFDVIVIDALYKALPPDVDENSNGQITAIYNLLDGYAQTSKAAFVLVHHTSKGGQANKSVTDVGSGAGAQSRSPDAHLTLRPHEEDGVVSVYCCVRSFPPVAPFCLRKDENNLWVLAPEFAPDDLEGKVKSGQSELAKKRKLTMEDVAETIHEYLDELKPPLPKTRLVEKMREISGASKSKVESAISLLVDNEILEERSGDPAKRQQAMKCYHFGKASPHYVPPKSLKATEPEKRKASPEKKTCKTRRKKTEDAQAF